MEINKNTIEASAEKKQKKSLLSVLNEKRKKIALSITTMLVMSVMTTVTAFATSGGFDTNAGANEFNAVIGFFATWIGRIGFVVGFVGAVMFGLAIKNDDADAKTRGLMTMASGFVVYAISKALPLFGIGGSATSGMIALALFSM